MKSRDSFKIGGRYFYNGYLLGEFCKNEPVVIKDFFGFNMAEIEDKHTYVYRVFLKDLDFKRDNT